MKLRLAEIFTSRMVLQHGKEINIFGTGETNQQVTITIQGQTATTTIINNNWLITLPTLEISTDETLTVSTGLETITLSNILIGDVYFLAGQSNIEFKFKDCDSVKVDQEVCYDRYLRYYEVPQIEYEDENIKIPPIRNQGWQICDNQTINDFSAIGYYLAYYLRHDIDIPIGLIAVNKGGTSGSCWINETYLQKNQEIKKVYYDEYYQAIMNQTEAQEDLKIAKYKERVKQYQQKVALYQQTYPERNMSQLKKDVGHTPWPGPRGKKDFCRPAGLYYTMFKKICQYSGKAVIWYQGEEDTKNAYLYHQLLQLVIENWREDMKAQIPFIIVQLPEYDDDKNDNWPILRDAQQQVCREVPACYLVVTMNCGEEFNIHPQNKKTVGHRIFWRIKELFYDNQFNGHSPKIINIENNSKIIIEFDQKLHSRGINNFILELPDHQVETVGIIKENKLLVERPAQVRTISYGYQNYCKISIFGENNLPIAPFKIQLTK